jgi:AcrR family transcriptional regulator
MGKKIKDGTASSTIRIKQAAHKLFLQNGYGSTSIREIAETAGTNVALLNYHFGSKQNLFEVVILEKIQLLLGRLTPIFSDEHTSLGQKIEAMVHTYIDFLLEDPDLLTFVLNEIRKNNFEFIAKTRLGELVHQSFFMKQLKAATGTTHPLQLLMSIVSMMVYPFMAKPVIIQTRLADDHEFHQMMLERKKLIPIWVRSMLKSNES